MRTLIYSMGGGKEKTFKNTIQMFIVCIVTDLACIGFINLLKH